MSVLPSPRGSIIFILLLKYLVISTLMYKLEVRATTVAQALANPDWVEAMQVEMQQFMNQKVWVLVTLPDGKWAIGTKWILKNKRDARGIVCRNKARLVAQGHRQEEGIDYTDVFAPVSRIEAIRLFLAFASFIGFMMYHMDVKSAFFYGKIAEEVYVTQPRGFKDPYHPKKVYNVVKALHQVTPNTSNLLSIKRIFKYLTVNPKLGLWYPRDSPFDLEAFSDSDYASTNGDRKSTTGGCQFLGRRDANEKKLIQVLKIPTKHNVADLLTKSFDVTRFGYLVVKIGDYSPLGP
uniref:Putative ribonuclease H-like domain-containing protein n=1 Tax=Tanacetum cinerariifolium TaxID=118510 RepID=A0A699KM28_TANCI|nr:putative ribonuclease H-like domain-containing protein [Tanacetum cinerariifolium]